MPKINEAGLQLIKSFESLRLDAHHPVPGDPLTIGWGHTGSDVKEGMVIAPGRADELLRQDIAWAENAVIASVRVPLTPNQFSALVSFVFNAGPGPLQKSVGTAVNRRDWAGAVTAMKRYIKAGDPLVVYDGLVRRRDAEASLFQTDLAYEPADYRLISPADDPSSIRWVTRETVEALRWMAEVQRLPFRVDEETKKVYFLKRQSQHPPVDTPDGPNIRKLLKAGDVHIVCNRHSRGAMAFSADGKKLWKEPLKVLMEGVMGKGPDVVHYTDTGSDTPPGLWLAGPVEDLPRDDRDWRAYGWTYIYLEAIGGVAANDKRVGEGWHGGGSATPDPWAARQPLVETEGCIRSANEDVRDVVGPLVRKTRAAGHKVYVTTE